MAALPPDDTASEADLMGALPELMVAAIDQLSQPQSVAKSEGGHQTRQVVILKQGSAGREIVCRVMLSTRDKRVVEFRKDAPNPVLAAPVDDGR